ncbi:MAG: thiamine-phosphate kinase [Actinomycetota bacterium]
MEYEGKTVFEVGEKSALAQTLRHFKPVKSTIIGSGDDSAVIGLSSNQFVVTTDSMVEGRDFRSDFSTGYDIGYKAAATNLSDVAAMGAQPISLVVALLITRETKLSWLEDFAKGLQAALDELAPSAAVVGGDLALADQIVVAVTAHGDLQTQKPILRSGAQPGDVLAVAGTLGKAAAGLSLLLHDDKSLAASYPELVAVQLRPKPPISLAVGSTAKSMLDISDSLALDANRLAAASNVLLRINRLDLHGYSAVLEQAAQSISARDDKTVDPLDWVLYGGEDHGFLATFSPDSVPMGFRKIGAVEVGSGVYLDSEPLAPRGWDSVSS